MAGIYGRRWAASFGSAPVGDAAQAWRLATDDLTDEQVDAAYRYFARCGREWPPSAPEFRRGALRLPSLAEARLEMLEPPERQSPFARALNRALGRLGYKVIGDPALRETLLREQYEHLCQRALRDGAIALSEPPPTAPAQPRPQRLERTARADAVAQAAISDLAKRLGLGGQP